MTGYDDHVNKTITTVAVGTVYTSHQLSSFLCWSLWPDHVTCVTMLPVWLCYLSDNITCVAMLPVWQCHLYDNVIYVTMLPAWQCYLCDNVTCVAMSPVWLLPVWLCHLHDNVTCMTVLPAWQCHLCDDVTCVAVTCVATLISASWPESFRTNDIIGWSSCTLSHQTQHMLSQFTNASTLGVS